MTDGCLYSIESAYMYVFHIIIGWYWLCCVVLRFIHRWIGSQKAKIYISFGDRVREDRTTFAQRDVEHILWQYFYGTHKRRCFDAFSFIHWMNLWRSKCHIYVMPDLLHCKILFDFGLDLNILATGKKILINFIWLNHVESVMWKERE